MKNFWASLIRPENNELDDYYNEKASLPLVKASHRAASKRNFEIKQKIYFPEEELKKTYHIETWFFFPTALQVNRWTYQPKSFASRLKNYIRLRPPTEKLENITVENGVLSKLEQALNDLIKNKYPQSAAHYEHSLKLFCLIYKRSLGIAFRAINALTDEKKQEAMPYFADEIGKILSKFRALKEQAEQVASKLSAPAYLYCDEYLAIITTFRLYEMLNNIPLGEGKDYLRNFYKQEMNYRVFNYSESVARENSDNERSLYRWNVLKKYISSPLFLDLRQHSGETWVAHLIYSIAAAVAMIFATAIAFFWQDKYGALSSPMFVALVIGYIFKDRIKDICRIKMFNLFRRWLPDRRLVIYKNLKTPIGRCEEMFQFVSEKRVPSEILKLRDFSHFIDLDNSYHSEDIFYYAKNLTIENVEGLFCNSQRSLMDISRLEISDFLKQADDINDESMLTEDEQAIVGDKIYHINMIRRITRGSEVEYERVRLVVNKMGIKRIEVIVPLTHQIPA